MADRNKNKEIFREKSIERISSPDDLNKYIRSTTPSLWLMLGSIIFLLVGVLIWAGFGKIDSSSIVGSKVASKEMVSYIKEIDYGNVCEESYLEVNGVGYEIKSVNGPTLANEKTDSFLMQAAGINEGDWFYSVICVTDLEDGEYKGNIVFEKVSPIVFIFN